MRFDKLFLLIVSFICIGGTLEAASPNVPRGESQSIYPMPSSKLVPGIVPPPPKEEPVGFDMKAYILVDGVQTEITENVVKIEVGRMLVMELVGGDLDKTPRAADWSLSRASDNISIYPKDGRRITFTATGKEQGAYLFFASVNSLDPLAKPLTAMRWVIVGEGPGPIVPPGPGPGPGPDPKPPVTEGKRSVVIIRESSNDTPALARLMTGLTDGAGADYLKSKGHSFAVLDPDEVDENGQPSALVKSWQKHYAGMTMPVVFIIDSATNSIIVKQAMPDTMTWNDVLTLLKSNGG